MQAKWLVGADGARSNVRKQLGLTFLGESDATISSVIGDIEIEALGDVDGTVRTPFSVLILCLHSLTELVILGEHERKDVSASGSDCAAMMLMLILLM